MVQLDVINAATKELTNDEGNPSGVTTSFDSLRYRQDQRYATRF